jgi:CheY-like chemotaxis protein
MAAEDPRQGIELFQRQLSHQPFVLVVTDLAMPHMDGRAVARAIKQASATTPVILLTGWGQAVEAEGRLEHIDVVLGKPPKIRELRAALAQLPVVATRP